MTEIVGSLKNNLSTAEHKVLANITRIQKSSLHKKRSFPLSISTVNVTKSPETADLVTFTGEIANGKFHFFFV